MAYSLLFAIFEVYMVSYIGEKWNPSTPLKYIYIAPENSKAANVVLAVLFAYLSVQRMSIPGMDTLATIPVALLKFSDSLLILAFAAVFIYTLAYPNYLTIVWLMIVFVASFSTMATVRKAFLPFLTLIFTLSFVAMVLTTFGILEEPPLDGKDELIPWLELFGFYRYRYDFTFAVLGFYLICLLGTIGRIAHAASAPMRPSRPVVKVASADAPADEAEAERRLTLEILEAEKARRRRHLKRRISQIFSFVADAFLTLFGYCASRGLLIVLIVGGFYPDRLSFIILSVCAIVIILCALYKQWLFQTIKFVTGVLLLIGTFYKACFNENCEHDLDGCLVYGKWSSDPMDMIKTGLVARFDESLLSWGWPLFVTFFLSVFLTGAAGALDKKLPPVVTGSIFVIVGALHFLYVLLYDTDLFSLLFTLVGIGMWISQYLGHRILCAVASCLSCIMVTFQLGLKYLTHFDGPRNLIGALLERWQGRVYNVSKIVEPSGEIVLLGFILFLSTVAFNSNPSREKGFIARNILYEGRMLLHMFFHYVSWIFTFLFAICNDYPSFLKLIVFLPFALGRFSVRVFAALRIPFIILQLALLCGQFIVQLGGFDDPSGAAYPWLRYLGLFFGGIPTHAERNVSLFYQLCLVFSAIVNTGGFDHRALEPEWEDLLPVRIYNAFAAFLHFCLPLIVQISLCVSAFINPSVFGLMFFVVMVMVTFFPSLIRAGGSQITFAFNICMLAQYLMYLGWPIGIFSDTRWNVLSNTQFASDESRERTIEWLMWLGIYEVRQAALVTNCISMFFFTLDLDFRRRDIDYEYRFKVLPHPLRALSRLVTVYIFEIMMTFILCFTYLIETLDGLFFFILTGCLFMLSMFYEYPRDEVIRIMSIGTFCAIAMHLLSRLPIFTESGIGRNVQKAFDLPFQGESNSEVPWIVVYALGRLLSHIMRSDMFKRMSEEHERHLAYRFIRARQIRRLTAIDVEILQHRHDHELEQVRELSSQTPEEMIASLHRTEGVFARIESKTTQSIMSSSLDRSFSQTIWLTIVQPFIDHFFKIFAQTFSLNSEAGINISTLESLTQVLDNELEVVASGRTYLPEPAERNFLRSLPPSFPLHFQSLLDVIGDDVSLSNTRGILAIRYFLMFIRRIQMPFFILVLFLYIMNRPYIWAMFVMISFMIFTLPLDLRGITLFLKITMGLSMFILALKHIACIPFVKDEIIESLNSVAVQRARINVFSLLGLNPTESGAYEILILVGAVAIVIDQLAQTEAFSVDYYTSRFKRTVPGFPKELCEHVIEDPVKELHMRGDQAPHVKDQIKQFFGHIGALETSHSTWLLLLDMISFIILFACWGSWTSGDSEAALESDQVATFQINAPFIMILFFHILFTLALYWSQMSSHYLFLFCTSAVWLVIYYCIIFFYIPSVSRSIPLSAYIFFTFRFFCSILVAHKCVVGREVLAFKYPNFALDWVTIMGFDIFMRACPFVFEINSLLQWMSRDTFLPLLDFFIIRDLALQLEVLIARQMNPSYGEPRKPGTMRLIGAGLLAALAALLFIPLFFFLDSTGSRVLNPPRYVKLEIGIGDLPPLYSASAGIESVTVEEQQQLSDTSSANLSFMYLNSRDLISKVEFPTFSFENWEARGSMTTNLSYFLNPESGSVFPYYSFTIYFDYPTTQAASTHVQWDKKMESLNSADRDLMLAYLERRFTADVIAASMAPMSLPLGFAFATGDDVTEIEFRTNAVLKPEMSGTFEWQLDLAPEGSIPFLTEPSRYRVLMWSQAVDTSNWAGTIGSSGGVLGIYIGVMLAIGILLRVYTLRGVDELWISRMERPEKLYRLVVATEAFRAANYLDKELGMVQRLLNTLRSQEQCLRITASDAPE